MDSKKTYVDFEKFEQAITESGLPWEEKAGWVKVNGARGRKVYVARTKRVGRVDISGFEYDGEGVQDLGDMRFGAVTQQLDFEGRTEDQILDSFVDVLGFMAKLPPAEPRARAARGTGQEEGTASRGRPSMSSAPPLPATAAQHGRVNRQSSRPTASQAAADEQPARQSGPRQRRRTGGQQSTRTQG